MMNHTQHRRHKTNYSRDCMVRESTHTLLERERERERERENMYEHTREPQREYAHCGRESV